MSNAAQLQTVLDRIDADFDNSLQRLFALLRIKSISADPAFALERFPLEMGHYAYPACRK